MLKLVVSSCGPHLFLRLKGSIPHWTKCGLKEERRRWGETTWWAGACLSNEVENGRRGFLKHLGQGRPEISALAKHHLAVQGSHRPQLARFARPDGVPR